MPGSSQTPTAQSNVKIMSIHTLLCRFQGHYVVMKVNFMVDCTSQSLILYYFYTYIFDFVYFSCLNGCVGW
jgi:hypothetical protein